MDINNNKCVMVLDADLPLGLLANTSAILGFTMGKLLPEMAGPDVIDKSGKQHLGIIAVPIPILKGDKEIVRNIREKLYQPEFSEVVVVNFFDAAQSCNPVSYTHLDVYKRQVLGLNIKNLIFRI